MARLPPLDRLDSVHSYQDLIPAMQSIKNEIVGHVQRKEHYVEQGLLDSLTALLGAPSSSSQLGGREVQKKLSASDNFVLQSLQILNSLVLGGPPFLAPIYASGALAHVLTHIDSPPQVSLAALRILDNLADGANLADATVSFTTQLADALFHPHHLETLHSILASPSRHRVVQQQKCLVATLIGKLCRTTHHQNTLANGGILDVLATLLMSILIARGEMIPGAPDLAKQRKLDSWIPQAAPAGLDQNAILEAISNVVADSRVRAAMLLWSPSIMAVLPPPLGLPNPGKHATNAWRALEKARLAPPGFPRGKPVGAMEYLLPLAPRPTSLLQGQFPALGYPIGRERSKLAEGKLTWDLRSHTFWDPSSRRTAEEDDDFDHDLENPLIPWLIHLVRSSDGLDRISAASLLTSLHKSGFARQDREILCGLTVVPSLCRSIQQACKEMEKATVSGVEAATNSSWAVILERAPAIIARLVANSDHLQQVANDCGIIKITAKLLKGTYERLASQHVPPTWSAAPKDASSDAPPTRRLGEPGHLPLYIHRIRVRESCLRLMASLCTIKDALRKDFVAQEIIPHVVESLRPCPSKPSLVTESDKNLADGALVYPPPYSPYGNNPSSVIIAACHVVRVFARAPAIVRTSLKDHGAAMPVFRLLKHADVDVQIAACGTMCNLVVEVSPMRDTLVEAGVLPILCENTRSLNAGLRLNSMWALKHLVDAIESSVKKQALEQLESGWLIRLICDDTEDSALHDRLMKAERRMSLDGDQHETEQTGEEGDRQPWAWPALYRASANHLPVADRKSLSSFQHAEKKLLALREAESNPGRKARKDDLAIQEQGLDFIRNLMGPPKAGEDSSVMPEMVDFVLNEIGQDRLFEVLQSKLRPKAMHPFELRHPALGREAKVLYPQARMIEAVVYILVHIATSVPRHRQLITAQTDLLRLLAAQFNNGSSEVRRALCHLMSNLVTVDDPHDAEGSYQRAAELKRLGFQTKLESIEHEDVALDVKQQARHAAFYMQQDQY